MVREIPGPVLEFGLGNGRTYDHLRELLPDREIFVFDRRIAAHPDCIPDDAHMFLGDVTETLPLAAKRISVPVALAHSDLGTGITAANEELASFVGPHLAALMAPGGLIVSDQAFHIENWTSVDLPTKIAPERYFMYRAG